MFCVKIPITKLKSYDYRLIILIKGIGKYHDAQGSKYYSYKAHIGYEIRNIIKHWIIK